MRAGCASTRHARYGLLCNETTMTAAGPVGGNALDLALVSRRKRHASSLTPDGSAAYERLGLLPFDHERQLASVVVRSATASVSSPRAHPRRCWRAAPTCRRRPGGARAALRRRRARGRRARPAAAGPTAPSAADERDLQLDGLSHVRRSPEGRRRRGGRASSRASASRSRSSPATTAPSPARSAATSASRSTAC